MVYLVGVAAPLIPIHRAAADRYPVAGGRGFPAVQPPLVPPDAPEEPGAARGTKRVHFVDDGEGAYLLSFLVLVGC